ncbi:MAG: hypothetical protein SGILL_002927 [Bacillariaceae sp.]
MCRSSSLTMIEELASLVTDLEVVSASTGGNEKHDEAQTQNEQQHPSISTPSSTTSDKKSFRNSHSPTSSADKLYEDLEQQPLLRDNRRRSGDPLPQKKTRRLRRPRPSALEISCLSNWRHHMFDWACTVCHGVLQVEHNHCGTVVATTFSILDRYVLSKENDNALGGNSPNPLGISKEDFQLYVMVSLYIAAKTLISAERNKLSIATMVSISQGLYLAEDITATERAILLALDWHVNPPTVSCFCRRFLELFPFDHEDCDPKSMAGIARHQCEYLAELALDDVFFLDKAASTVGLAVVVMVTDSLRNKRMNSKGRRRSRGGALSTFLQNIQGVVNVHNAEFDLILRRLECFM